MTTLPPDIDWHTEGEALPDDAAVIPRANSITATWCQDPGCPHLHLILLDENKNPIAQAVADDRMIASWLILLARRPLPD